jgi:predicted Zn-dependent protease
LLFAAGCETSGLSAKSLSPLIGERNASLLDAGGKLFSAASLSEKDEDAIGQSVAVGITNRYPPVANTNLQRYVNLVGLAVASASANPGGNWVFGVIETPEVNAYSGPNGYIFITRGALSRMQDESELAGVLAHEIAHVCNHDGLTQIKNNETKGALVQGLKAADSRTAAVAAFADNGLDVVMRQGYDQQQELTADAHAVNMVAAAGYNPYGYRNYLVRLRDSGSAAGGGRVMSTHPGIGDRINRVNQALAGKPNSGATLQARFQGNAINLR